MKIHKEDIDHLLEMIRRCKDENIETKIGMWMGGRVVKEIIEELYPRNKHVSMYKVLDTLEEIYQERMETFHCDETCIHDEYKGDYDA